MLQDFEFLYTLSPLMLMTDPLSLPSSVSFDGIHIEDLMGVKAIKKRYWDIGNLQIEAHYRRRNIDDEWIWITGKVNNVMEHPIPGLVMKERRPVDEYIAMNLSKFTRVASIVADVIEQSYSWIQLKNESTFDSAYPPKDSQLMSQVPGHVDEAAALKAFLDGGAAPNDATALHRDMSNTAQQDHLPLASSLLINSDSAAVHQRAIATISSVLDVVTDGPCVHINKITLSTTIVNMIVLLLAGYLEIDDLALYMLNPVNSALDMDTFLEYYASKQRAHQEQDEPPQSVPVHSHSHSRRRHRGEGKTSKVKPQVPIPRQVIESIAAPPIACINISYSAIGDDGMEKFCEIFCANTRSLITVDVGFCNIRERGMLALCRSLYNRRRRGLPSLQGLILSGNSISFKAAKELGHCLSPAMTGTRSRRHSTLMNQGSCKEGYDEDDESGSDDYGDADDDDLFGGEGRKRASTSRRSPMPKKGKNFQSSNASLADDPGIKLLRLTSTSMTGSDILELMLGLTDDCLLEELDIASNRIGVDGISLFLDFLEGKNSLKKMKKKSIVMPKLNRINLSDNDLGNDGIAKLTRAISRRKQQMLVDLHLSFNNVKPLGTGTIMNKLLQHNLVSLSLDNNLIGDSGCQLVAASLTSMHYLSRLNLSFNQIGCRGITSLMRALLGCETINYLGLSGNVMKITGAIAMGFALAHHPRLAHLDLDNCCLSQVAQCHISAGMISNRWVPMQIVNGFKVGPPLAAIGALDIIAQHLGNIECLSIRRNMQMKANLQWMEAQKASMAAGAKMGNLDHQDISSDVPSSDAINGPPSQSAYLRMLDWLSRIPFDEDELDNLRRYFYDIDDESPDGLRGSDGRLNLKVRGDLLAALGSNLEKEMLENEQNIIFPDGPSIGMCLWPEDANSDDEDSDMGQFESYEVLWNSSALVNSLESRKRTKIEDVKQPSSNIHEPPGQSYHEEPGMTRSESSWRRDRGSIARIESQMSTATASSQGGKNSKSLKARISMFPQFLDKLDLLKGNAQDMMDAESDSTQQDIIAQQFAEASLILLRQLRYHCMNSGLDGWRQGKSRRKILIVDDSMVTRKLVARAFEKANFIVDTAQNGEEGVAMMKKSIYDIAFMDIDMPVMNGFDATKALREWENLSRPGARQPICALTAAYVDDFEISELMKFKEAGLDVMESKPCNIPRLFKVVDDVSPMFSDLSISVTQHL